MIRTLIRNKSGETHREDSRKMVTGDRTLMKVSTHMQAKHPHIYNNMILTREYK